MDAVDKFELLQAYWKKFSFQLMAGKIFMVYNYL